MSVIDRQVHDLVAEAVEQAAKADTLPSAALLGLNEFSFLPFDENGVPDYGDGLCIGWMYFADTTSTQWPQHLARATKWLQPSGLSEKLETKAREARFVAMAHNVSLEINRSVYFASGRDLPAFAAKAAKLIDTLDGNGATHIFVQYVGDQRFSAALQSLLPKSGPVRYAPPSPR